MKEIPWSDLAFALVLAVTTILFFIILLPFLPPLIFSMFLVILVFPIYERVVRWFGGRRRLASIAVSLAVVLAVIAPSVAVAYVLVERGILLFSQLSEALAKGPLHERLGVLEPILGPLLEPLDEAGLPGALREMASRAAKALSSRLAPAVAAIGRLVIGAFIVILGLYYLLLDGRELVEEVVEITPIEREYSREIAEDLGAVLRSLFLASFFTAIVQGALGLGAFWLVSLPHALIWASLMAFFSLLFSLVPILGTSLVWVPVMLWLLLEGRIWAGIFILVFGLIVLGSVDLFVRPLVARATARLHPLIVLLTLFGGIGLFGPIGALLGPLVGALTVAFARVWSRDVRQTLS